MSHTPGPWHVELGGFIYSKRKKVADIGENVGRLDRRISAEPERTANARLIAAAPELLEALEKCVSMLLDKCNCLEECYCVPESARKAIQKAREP